MEQTRVLLDPNLENRTREWIVAVVALALPTLITYIYFNLLSESNATLQQIAMGGGKAVQFGLPVVWIFWVLKYSASAEFKLRFGSLGGVGFGLAFGLVIAAAMMALYHLGLKPSGAMDAAAVEIRDKVAGMNINTVAKYAALGVFYSLVHSLMEEYYWRWFVFGRLRKLVPLVAAIVVSGLGFMAHHVLVLGTFFGYGSFYTYFFSLSVAVGGFVWAWLYNRNESIWGPWMSHLLVDAAIFIIGYDLIFGQ